MTYPVLPSPTGIRLTPSGVFDPVAGSPALINGTGTPNTIYVVSRAGPYDFDYGLPSDYGTALSGGDLIIYSAGVWRALKMGAGPALTQRVFSIASDSAISISYGRAAGFGSLLVTSDPTLPSALIMFDLRRPVLRLVDGDALFEAGEGELDGSTGNDGVITVSAHNGRIWVENRTPAEITLVFDTNVEAQHAGALPRSGILPMAGSLDMDNHPILLRTGQVRGLSADEPAALVWLEVDGGSFAARNNLIALRGRLAGESAQPQLARHELAVDATPDMGTRPKLWIGLDNAGTEVVIVGPERQVELAAVDQVILGTKTFRALRFGASGQEMTLPTARGSQGQALVLGANGAIGWGGITLSANVQILVLPGVTAVTVEFNAEARTIGPQDLLFLKHGLSTYVWVGGSGTFGGLGNPQAEPEDISTAIFTAGAVPYASAEEVEAGIEAAKAISPAVAAVALVLKQSADNQIIDSDVTINGRFHTTGLNTIDGRLSLRGFATIEDAPRAGDEGQLDLVNRSALDARFQSSPDTPTAGRAPIMDADGLLSIAVLPFEMPLDFLGLWTPDGAGLAPRNITGGGLSSPARGGETLLVAADGNWNFAAGVPDATAAAVTAGQLIIFDPAGPAWRLVAGGGGGASAPTNAVLTDGSRAMTGNFTVGRYAVLFADGGRIAGASATAPVVVSNARIDAGFW